MSIGNRSTSRCKSNKKPMSVQYRVPTELEITGGWTRNVLKSMKWSK